MSTAARRKTCKVQKGICVGIVTLPHSRKTKFGTSHIIKQYVDWFEERGIRVIPIPFDTTQPELYFEMTNGLFLPGTDKGYDIKNKALMLTIRRFIELSTTDYYPIWGTCFGFQLIIQALGGTLAKHPANGLSAIHLTAEGRESTMMKGFSASYLKYLEERPSTLQYHDYGISTYSFLSNAVLRKWFRVLATAVDEEGKEYVTAIEGKRFPIYGVQSHPERQRNSQPYLRFFLSELKKSNHSCASTIPFLRKTFTPHRCTHYVEQKEMLCYYF